MGKKRARPVVDSAPAQPTQRADGATGKKKAAGPKKALASGEGEVPTVVKCPPAAGGAGDDLDDLFGELSAAKRRKKKEAEVEEALAAVKKKEASTTLSVV